MTKEVPFEDAWDRKDWAKEIAELQKSLEKERRAKLSISKQYKESVERLFMRVRKRKTEKQSNRENYPELEYLLLACTTYSLSSRMGVDSRYMCSLLLVGASLYG